MHIDFGLLGLDIIDIGDVLEDSKANTLRRCIPQVVGLELKIVQPVLFDMIQQTIVR